MEKTKFNRGKNTGLLIMFILFVVFQTAGMIIQMSIAKIVDITWIAGSAVFALAGLFIYISYRNHTKNVMKPLLGATLTLLLVDNLDVAFDNIQDFSFVLELFKSEAAFIVLLVLEIVIFVVIFAINIMHYVINATHHSSPRKTLFNQMLYVAYIALLFIESVLMICIQTDFMFSLGGALTVLADIFLLSMVIFVETFLDEYRLERESEKE